MLPFFYGIQNIGPAYFIYYLHPLILSPIALPLISHSLSSTHLFNALAYQFEFRTYSSTAITFT